MLLLLQTVHIIPRPEGGGSLTKLGEDKGQGLGRQVIDIETEGDHKHGNEHEDHIGSAAVVA